MVGAPVAQDQAGPGFIVGCVVGQDTSFLHFLSPPCKCMGTGKQLGR